MRPDDTRGTQGEPAVASLAAAAEGAGAASTMTFDGLKVSHMYRCRMSELADTVADVTVISVSKLHSLPKFTPGFSSR